MAGKKGQKSGTNKPKPGAGRPRKVTTMSEKQKKKWVAAAKRFAKKHGITVEDAILDMIMDPEVQDTCRVAAAKLYAESTIAKETYKKTEIKDKRGPGIGLPPMRKDPALQVVDGGK